MGSQAVIEKAHGTFEINSVAWAPDYQNNGEDVLITAGDDNLSTIWKI